MEREASSTGEGVLRPRNSTSEVEGERRRRSTAGRGSTGGVAQAGLALGEVQELLGEAGGRRHIAAEAKGKKKPGAALLPDCRDLRESCSDHRRSLRES